MHFEVRPKDFNAFWSRPGFILFVLFVYFYLFTFISIDFHWFPWFPRFPRIFISYYYYFPEFANRRLLPHFQNRSDSKMPTGRGNLRTESFHFFFKGSSESIFPSQWSNSGRSCDENNNFFWIFVNFAIFGSPEPTFSRISWISESGRRILIRFGARPKDFNTFWSPAEGF